MVQVPVDVIVQVPVTVIAVPAATVALVTAPVTVPLKVGLLSTGLVNVCTPPQLCAVEYTLAPSIALRTLLAPMAVTPPALIVTSPVTVWQIGSAAVCPTASCALAQSSEV